jgi:ankyrin repeat protein
MKRGLALILLLASVAQAAPVDELTKAAEFDDGRAVTTLLVRGVDPNARDARGRTALEAALQEGSPHALESLLKHPLTEVDRANANGETPLMLAALKGQLDAVKKLTQRGAAVNKAGWTPLHYACSGPDEGVVAWLLSHGAEVDARSPNGSTPLMMAARYGSLDAPAMLLKAGADVSLRNEQNLSALDFARAAGRDTVIKLLTPK